MVYIQLSNLALFLGVKNRPKNGLLILTHYLKGLPIIFQKIIKLTLLVQRNEIYARSNMRDDNYIIIIITIIGSLRCSYIV